MQVNKATTTSLCIQTLIKISMEATCTNFTAQGETVSLNTADISCYK